MSESISKEEIAKRVELMKQNCIFCKIVKREIDSNVVFEDDICMAILDINPSTQGHILLMPKEHYMMLPMVTNEVLGHITVISKYLSDLLKQSLNANDVTIYMANGAAAGQQSQHFMIHIIPRYDGDGIDFNLNSDKKMFSDDEFNNLVKKLKISLENFK